MKKVLITVIILIFLFNSIFNFRQTIESGNDGFNRFKNTENSSLDSDIEFDLVYDNSVNKTLLSRRSWSNLNVLVQTNISLVIIDLFFIIQNSTVVIAPENDEIASIDTSSKAGFLIVNSTIINESKNSKSSIFNISSSIDTIIANSSIYSFSDTLIFEFSQIRRVEIVNSNFYTQGNEKIIETNDVQKFEMINSNIKSFSIIESSNPIMNIFDGRKVFFSDNVFEGNRIFFNISNYREVEINGNLFANFSNIFNLSHNSKILFLHNIFNTDFSPIFDSNYLIENEVIEVHLNNFYNISNGIISNNETLKILNFSHNYYDDYISFTDFDQDGFADQSLWYDLTPIYYESYNYDYDYKYDQVRVKSIYKLQIKSRDLNNIFSLGLLPATLLFSSIFIAIVIFSLIKLFMA